MAAPVCACVVARKGACDRDVALENANRACESISSPTNTLASARAILFEKIEVARRKVMSGRVRAGGEPFAIRGRFIRESDSIRQFGNTRKRARAKGSSGT
ncbi:hypothetical protein MASR2M50_34920 [Thauera sp.]